jgi:hypothetical protein
MTGLAIAADDTFRLTLEVHDNTFTGRLYTDQGELLDTIVYTDDDAAYRTGSVGTWASRVSGAIGGVGRI